MKKMSVYGQLLTLGILAAAAAKSPDLILKYAHSNLNTMAKNGEVVSTLSGNVVFIYDDATIRSEYAKWLKSAGIVTFSDRVKIDRKDQTMTSDRMDFDKNKKWLTADGHIDFFDKHERVQLNGDRGYYYTDSKVLTVEGRPRFVFYDTTAHDTLEIRGRKITYDDSLKKATVIDNVTIHKGKLFSRCKTAVYYPDSGMAQLRTTPDIAYEADSIRGDSVDLHFTKKVLKKMNVKGNSHGLYRDFGKTDTALTQVLGDSLAMFLTDSGKIDSLWAFGNVKSKYYPQHKPLQSNEVYGKVMAVSFNSRGDVNGVKVWGNSRSVYNIEEKDGRGMNVASGDSITVGFKAGKATHVTMAGSVRGYYAPLPQLPPSPAVPEKKEEQKPVSKDVAK
jgi:lipopolysaccharide export system protein LptA